MRYWLVKQEPEAYSWRDFVQEGQTAWTGVRSYPARMHLRAMRKGDLVLFYHSGTGKEVVGITRVTKEAYPDPTAKEGEWSAVDLKPVKPLKVPVSLQSIMADKALKQIALVKQSRLSVMPLGREEFERLLQLGQTTAP